MAMLTLGLQVTLPPIQICRFRSSISGIAFSKVDLPQPDGPSN
jgi:hypothetical protein